MICAFCGQDRKRSREHVFATWMEEFFPDIYQGEAEYIRRTVTHAGQDSHNRPGPAFDFVTSDVCEPCNNGWMSALEGQVKPILGPMLLDQPRVLTAPEQLTLATWATKTMLAMGGVNLNGERVVNSDRYRWFEHYRAPLPNSHIWLIRFNNTGDSEDETRVVTAHQFGMTLGPADDPTLKPGDPLNGYGVVFTVGPIGFWLFGYDLPGPPQTAARSDDARLLIWPALGPDVYWPPPNTYESEQALMELAQTVPTGTLIRSDSIKP